MNTNQSTTNKAQAPKSPAQPPSLSVAKTLIPLDYDKGNPKSFFEWLDYIKCENVLYQAKQILSACQ